MQVIICDNYEEMSREGAKIIASQVILKPNSVLGLATGSTPVGLYQNLIKMYQNKEIDFSNVTSFNLDEYYPISPDNDQSYHYFMEENLFKSVNIKESFVPDGSGSDIEKVCEDYEEKIKAYGGIDLQLLGIGQNGHIGFNEPDEFLIPNTHCTDLTEDTIKANSRFFESIDQVPTKAITMGMATILNSKKILILANGKNKHNAVKALLDDKITTNVPATMLKVHPDVVLIVDKDAYNG